MKKVILSLLLAVVMLLGLSIPVMAADPTVTITVAATVISITNTQSTWAIGSVEPDDVIYFSATGLQNDTYSQVENTGNVSVDVEIQGTDFEGGTYDWVLQSAPGDQIYSLYANSEATPTVYDVEVKSSVYGDLTTDLATSGTYDWSMKFTAPTVFDPADAGASKDATVTLVASKHV